MRKLAGRLIHAVRRTRRVSHEGLWFQVGSRYVDAETAYRIRHGTWERPEIAIGATLLRPDLPLIEIGGGLGVTACHFNRLIKSPEQHHVIEMDEAAVERIKENGALNGCRFEVHHGAISYSQQTRRMLSSGARFSSAQRLGADGGVAVEAAPMTLSDVVAHCDITGPFNLVCDIEGEEAPLIHQDIELLKERAAVVVMEIHPEHIGADAAGLALAEILQAGFRISGWQGRVFGFINPRLQAAGD